MDLGSILDHIMVINSAWSVVLLRIDRLSEFVIILIYISLVGFFIGAVLALSTWPLARPSPLREAAEKYDSPVVLLMEAVLRSVAPSRSRRARARPAVEARST